MRLPAKVASVSTCHRRARRSTASYRKRAKLGPPHPTGLRWTFAFAHETNRATTSPTSWARLSE